MINGSSVREENDLAEERQREMVKKKKKKFDVQEYEGARNQSQEPAIFEFQRRDESGRRVSDLLE